MVFGIALGLAACTFGLWLFLRRRNVRHAQYLFAVPYLLVAAASVWLLQVPLSGPYRSSALLIGTVAAIALAMAVTKHLSPKRLSARLPLTAAYWAPVVLLAGAYLAYFVAKFFYRDEGEAAPFQTALFGIASALSLAISVSVLVSVRQTLRGEMELMSETAGLIRSVRRKLVFLVLTPTVGYPRAIREKNWRLLDDFDDALLKKLEELVTRARTGDDSCDVRVATLAQPDLDALLALKEPPLRALPPEKQAHVNAAGTYGVRAALLINRFQELVGQGLDSAPGSFQQWSWRQGCVAWKETGATKADGFPPLNIVIADDRHAIVFYNEPMLSPQPVGLVGRVTHEPEEVEALSTFVDLYVRSSATAVVKTGRLLVKAPAKPPEAG